jgi:signal transduction histidine kinase
MDHLKIPNGVRLARTKSDAPESCSVRSRAERLGGTFDPNSSAAGTELRFTIPGVVSGGGQSLKT